jgi:hypothetical protein
MYLLICPVYEQTFCFQSIAYLFCLEFVTNNYLFSLQIHAVSLLRSMNGKPHKTTQDFTALVNAVRRVHDECAATVNRTVNTTLTLRNWLIGSYIRDYEQNGSDRAQYGHHLLEKLSESQQECLDRCYTGRYLGLCRQLFDAYPSIRKSVISESGIALLPEIPEPTVAQPETRKSVISELGADPGTLIQRLSFTHLIELLALKDPLKRAFYEIECIRGNWSVRALKRQIATLYNTYVDFIRDGSCGNGASRTGDRSWHRLAERRAGASP